MSTPYVTGTGNVGEDGRQRPGPGSGPESHLAGHRPSAECSIVVITRDRRERLLATLAELSRLEEAFPLLVVDNGSNDGTIDAVRAEFPGVAVIGLHRNFGAVARNIGVQTVATPYVAFADDDTWWQPGSIRQAVDLFEQDMKLGVLTARIVVEPAGEPDPICAELEGSPLPRHPDFPGPQLVSFLAGASIVRRRAFLSAGGFHERLFIGGEEELLAADLLAQGWRIGYAPQLVVHHAPSSLRDAHGRRLQGIRNTLWFTWLRRPAPVAVRRTAALLRQVPPDTVSARALLAAARGAPWVLGERQVLPPPVESLYRLVDHGQLRSRARRYVS